MSEPDVFPFISVGYMHEGRQLTISLDQMRKYCRKERVDDLIDDLMMLCGDVVEQREPLGQRPLHAVEAVEDISLESLIKEFPDWDIWHGIDNRWHARLRGVTPPVMVTDDDLLGLREEIILKASESEDYWKSQALSSGWEGTDVAGVREGES
jgi:hypothetical protein